jgi:hypothetical protein
MKKIYTLLFISICALVQAQTAVPNGSFELWTSANYEIPQNYAQSSNPQAFFKSQAPFNCVKTTDAYHGTYALKLTTVVGAKGDTVMGYTTNGNPQNGNPCSWKGGVAYNQMPTGFKGHFKSNIVSGDSAGIILVFKNAAGTCLGTYMHKFGGVNPYTSFYFPFSPALVSAPDTVLIAVVSSDIFNNVQKVGSSIQLDSLAFTGGVSQPALFNGDFETWQPKTIKTPDNWFMDTDDQGNGVYQTADSYSGAYALEFKTYLGDNNGNPVARGGRAGTGYNQCPNGPGPCKMVGGYPFANAKDTLAFYYKYVPSGNDSAQVSIVFKKNGVQTFSSGKVIHSAATYQYMEVPFNMGSSPDTAVVEFQSSSWNDTLLSFVGSDLKVDGVHFKSQMLATGIKSYVSNKQVSIYPNPSSDGVFQIINVEDKDVISVYNILGEEVNAVVKREKDVASVRLSSDAPGIYFIQIIPIAIGTEGKIVTEKIIVK